MVGTSQMYHSGTVIVRADNTNIEIGTIGDFSTHSGYAVIEYTKTTDN